MTSGGAEDRGREDGGPGPADLDLDALLAEARRDLPRLGALEARAAQETGALLVDIRPEYLRRDEGEIPGSVVIDRNVLEWRFAPGSANRVDDLLVGDPTVVIICSEGYASSLAAASLRRLRVPGVTDLDGGYRGWKAAGLPWAPMGTADDRTLPTVEG